MEIVMIVLIGLGLAFDVFAIAVSQGSVLGNVKARGIVLMCLMVCVWQVVALTIGYILARLVHVSALPDEVRMVWGILAALILITLGAVKLLFIYQKKAIPEVLSDIDFKKTCGIASSTSIYTLFAGFACGLTLLNGVYMGIMICVTTIAIVIIGVYVGYRNGELDKRIYWTGGIFLIIAGALTLMETMGVFING